MFAVRDRSRGHRRMQGVSGTHDDGGEVLLLFKQLAEVTVCRTATILAGTLLRAVIGVYDFLTGLAACNAARDAERMGQLNGLVGAQPIPSAIDAKQFANGIAELMGGPLMVIRADFIGVADSHTLYVRFPQEAKHDAQTMG